MERSSGLHQSSTTNQQQRGTWENNVSRKESKAGSMLELVDTRTTRIGLNNVVVLLACMTLTRFYIDELILFGLSVEP